MKKVLIYGQIHEYAMTSSGIHGKEFYRNGKILVGTIMDVAQKYGLDDPHIGYDTYNIEAEAMGMKVKYFENKVPALVGEPLVNKKKDLKNLTPPNPGIDGRMPFVLEVLKEYQKLDLVPKLHPSISFTAPFTLACQLRGIENFLMDILRDRDFAHDLLSFVTEKVLSPWIEVMKEVSRLDKPIFGGADALASPPNLALEGLKEFALSYILKLREHYGNLVTVQNWWGESYVDPQALLRLKLKVSPRIILGQDPDVEKLGPELYKEFAKKHSVALSLGIGPGFIMKASKQEVEQRIKQYIKKGRGVDKLFLYLCNVGTDTPSRNLEAAVQAVQQYGT